MTAKSTSSPVSVAEARARAARRVDRDQRTWAAYGGEDAALEIALRPPTERAVLADQAAIIDWVHGWREVSVSAGVVVAWEERSWPSVGRQTLPVRCVLTSADAIARFAGGGAQRGWALLDLRARALLDRLGTPPTDAALRAALNTHGTAIQRLPAGDFEILLGVVAWLVEHPSSGARVRQLPIEGVHTKWLEAHRAVVEGLTRAVTGRESLGLLGAPELLRMRFLDPTLRPGGLQDVTIPIAEAASLRVAPRVVLVLENLETLLSLPEVSGVVAVHGGGYAVGRLGDISWMHDARVLYWGDLDLDGFAILNRLRQRFPDAESMLMDEDTLTRFRHMWVSNDRAAIRALPALSPEERRTVERIVAEGKVRLEQERVPWAWALAALSRALVS
ncbi:Wadjet anti-phage system protein JetD domain-containing protein [Agromyces sp. GXS1127]|uniref:Wadjet anti-phage system protein JetD domain-containing protein n=1 Tax=Agromyces sp. GXS1127 TaxID=3424181 RepID=UPI003D31A04D